MPHRVHLAGFLVAITVHGLATAEVAGVRDAIIPGTVTLLDAEAIPQTAVLIVSLRDITAGAAKDATVARGTFAAEGNPPIPFELPYDKRLIVPSRLYGIEAIISDSRGRTLWETRVPIRVLTLGNQKRVGLQLRRAVPPKAEPEATAFALDCGSARFDVALEDQAATIVGLDAKFVLPRVEASAGKKFADGSSTLTVLGEAVYLQLPTRAYRDCKIVVRTP